MVLFGQEKLGFANLHVVEPHLMERYEGDLAAVAQFSNNGAAPLRSMRKFWLGRSVPMDKGKE